MKYERSKWTFSPSLMCMGYLSVGDNIQILNRYYDRFHVDIMDGHFCRSLHLSPDYIKDISKITPLPIEAHLMVENPEDYISQLINAGSEIIIVHIESSQKCVFRIIDYVHRAKKKIGIALCPSTPLETIKYVLERVDLVTVLNVDVGFAGQPLIPEMLDKIRVLKHIREKGHYNFHIQADGGVSADTYASLIQAGVDDFVIGRAALFGKSKNLNDSIHCMFKEFKSSIDNC